ncbi:Phage/plasmid primase [Spironucleus salmonicida]|nr:Phage/plasmid primase [Spironucleus salmonicida]
MYQTKFRTTGKATTDKLQPNLQLNQLDIDQDDNIIGVFNGIIQYDNNINNFQLLNADQCRTKLVTKSNLFEIQQQFIDKNQFLITPEQLSKDIIEGYDDNQSYYQIYKEVESIYSDIFNDGDDIEVFEFIILQGFTRMIHKTISNSHVLFQYGTGSDGKTFSTQNIMTGLGSDATSIQKRKISAQGYSSKVKSSVLQTSNTCASSHDSGGYPELIGKYIAVVSELNINVDLSVDVIKSLCCDTQVSCRKANASDVVSFTNKALIIIQSNSYPRFNQQIDDGLARRFLFYSHKVKFISEQSYNDKTESERRQNKIASVDIRTKMSSDLRYIDVFGFYMLQTYMKCIRRRDDYTKVTPMLQYETKQFQDNIQKYITECSNLLEFKHINFIYFKQYIKNVQNIIKSQEEQKNLNQQQVVIIFINQKQSLVYIYMLF